MDSIELRSEKVRSIIGKIPPRIVRSGTLVLFIVFISLIIGSYFFPYSETITSTVQIIEYQTLSVNSPSKKYIAIAYVPIDLQAKVFMRQQAIVEIEGFNKNTYGQIPCEVQSRINTPIVKEKKKYILIHLLLHNGLVTNNGTSILYYNNMQGVATIILKKERLLKILISWIK